jgi:hypothetical protein
VDLWNDPLHFKLESCFWNVRIWKWNGETKFKAKPVHCGLAPEWTYHYHRHAPFLLLHKGLMAKEDRERKIKRYEKYDPNAEHLGRVYYDMLKSDTARPFDEKAMADQIAEEVATYNQSKPRESMVNTPKPRFAYVKNPHGDVIDIPEKHVAMTLKRKGFEFVGWADDQQEEMEAMFEDEEEIEDAATENPPVPEPKNNYNRPVEDEKEEVEELEQKDEKQLQGFNAPVKNSEELEEIEEMFTEDQPVQDSVQDAVEDKPVAKKRAPRKQVEKK